MKIGRSVVLHVDFEFGEIEESVVEYGSAFVVMINGAVVGTIHTAEENAANDLCGMVNENAGLIADDLLDQLNQRK